MDQFCSTLVATLRMLFFIPLQQEVIEGCWAGNQSSKLSFKKKITDAVFLGKQTLIRVFVSWELIRDMINNLHKPEWELLGLKMRRSFLTAGRRQRVASLWQGKKIVFKPSGNVAPKGSSFRCIFITIDILFCSLCLPHVTNKLFENKTKYMNQNLAQVSWKKHQASVAFHG